jgi:hypothetical protein
VEHAVQAGVVPPEVAGDMTKAQIVETVTEAQAADPPAGG